MDKEKLRREFEKYKHLVDATQHAEKIRFLIENPELGEVNLNSHNIKPNCWGTTVFFLDAAAQVESLYPDNNYFDVMGNFVLIPDYEKPGYVGCEPMERFLETMQSEDLPLYRGSAVGLWWTNNSTEYWGHQLRHSGIFLGWNHGEPIMFHQESEGGPYGFVSLFEYEKKLHPEGKETLELKYHALLTHSFSLFPEGISRSLRAGQ